MGNRIVLKVHLLENNGLEIELFHLDPRFISKGIEFNHFYSNNFMIYSRGLMQIGTNSIRVPDEKNYQDKQSATKKFETEEKRREYLKGLHRCLIEWNNDFEFFKKGNDHKQRNRSMIMSGDFWVI
jgi:hypothetical protein